MGETADVVVIGAGAVGSACAYYLADAGLRVMVLEREAVGSGASTHAPGTLQLLSPEFKTEAHLRLGIESSRLTRELIPVLEELAGVNILYQRKPALRVALDEDEVEYVHQQMAWQGKTVPVKWISGDEARRIEPRLNPAVLGAAYQDESPQLDSARFTLALAMAAERRGAKLLLRPALGLVRDGDRVTGVHYRGGDVSNAAVVLAMGPWAPVASTWLSFNVPVRPLRGESVYLRFDHPHPPAFISSPKQGSVFSRLDGFLNVGSTGGRQVDDPRQYMFDQTGHDDFTVKPTEDALKDLLQRAVQLLPAIEDAEVALQLAGVRPMSPDGMPMIGPVPGCPGAYLAAGHSHKGIHLAAVTGRLISDLIRCGKTDLPVSLEPFSPARFAGFTQDDWR